MALCIRLLGGEYSRKATRRHWLLQMMAILRRLGLQRALLPVNDHNITIPICQVSRLPFSVIVKDRMNPRTFIHPQMALLPVLILTTCLSCQCSAEPPSRLASVSFLRLVMPDTPDPAGRRDSYGFSQGLDRSRSASNLFNKAITDTSPGGLGLGLRPTRSHLDLVRSFSPSRSEAGETPLEPAVALKKDTSRVEVLLISSAVKAKEIVLRADAIREPDAIPPVILETLAHGHAYRPGDRRNSVRRREEHVIAARTMINLLTNQSSQFNQKLKSFTITVTPGLQRELQILEDVVDNTLTPRVRAAVDEAGELSMKLTTTSTLAVKAINDSIESAMRRRRRGPVRWSRRAGYQIIEWMVVGFLWGIWFVVTIVRVTMAVVGGFGCLLGWLLWLK